VQDGPITNQVKSERFFYDGIQVNQKSWSSGVQGNGVVNLAAIDLYAGNSGPVYYDDLSLTRITPTLSGGGTVAYVENAQPVAVQQALEVSAFGIAQIDGATVRIAGNLHPDQDRLSVTLQGGITSVWDAVTGTLNLSGIATPADYQAVLRSVAYDNSSENPDEATRTLTFTVVSGGVESNIVSADVTVSPVNDSPVAASFQVTTDEDTGIVVVPTASDVDGGFLSWSIVSGPSHGTISGFDAATGSFSYVPNKDSTAADTASLAVSDTIATVPVSVSIMVTPVDDPAAITAPAATSVSIGSDADISGIVVADFDSPIVSVTVTVGAGTISFPQLVSSGASVESGEGIGGTSLMISGSPDVVSSALAQVVWRAPAVAGSTSLSIAGNGGTAAVSLTASNPNPAISIVALDATRWSAPPHGTRLLPTTARFWNIDVAATGRYHLWLKGGTTVTTSVQVDGAPSGAVLVGSGWNCRNTIGTVQTLYLAAGQHELSLLADGGSVQELILVAATPASAVHDVPIVAAYGSVSVIEAEDYDAAPGLDGRAWLPVAGPAGTSGIVVRALPDIGGFLTVGTAVNHRLDYAIYFAQPGTYRVWLRAFGDGNGDSFNVGLDGVQQQGGATWFHASQLVWTSLLSDRTTPVQIVVDSAGIHTLNVWCREDGARLDQIAVANAGAWQPGQLLALPAQQRVGVVKQPVSGGVIAIEAEAASQRLPGFSWTSESRLWSPVAMANAVGSALQVGPDTGGYYAASAGDLSRAPAATWIVDFAQAGTYDIWLRATGPDGAGDSAHVGLDGVNTGTTSISYLLPGPTLPWTWTNKRADSTKATLTVTSGLHVINLWMCEDGTAIDRIILQPTGTAAPTLDGPAQTPLGDLPAGSGNG